MTVKVILDSESLVGHRLTTLEVTLEKADLADLYSHRMLSVSPLPLPIPSDQALALVSATEWDNFIVSGHPVAEAVYCALKESRPKILRDGEWHLPFVDFSNEASADFVKFEDSHKALQISVNRCARKNDVHEELVRLRAYGYFEHQAQAIGRNIRVGNFIGWKQYRKTFEGEWLGRSTEYIPKVETGWTPFYARMEEAFKNHLVANARGRRAGDEMATEASQLLREFFPAKALELDEEREKL